MDSKTDSKKRKRDDNKIEILLFEESSKRYRKVTTQTVIENITRDQVTESKKHAFNQYVEFKDHCWVGRYTYGIFWDRQVCWDVIQQCYNREHETCVNAVRHKKDCQPFHHRVFYYSIAEFRRGFESEWHCKSHDGLSFAMDNVSAPDGHGELYNFEHMIRVYHELQSVKTYLEQ